MGKGWEEGVGCVGGWGVLGVWVNRGVWRVCWGGVCVGEWDW